MLQSAKFAVRHYVIRMYFNAKFVENGYAKKFSVRVVKEFTVKNTHYQNAKFVVYLFAMTAS